MKSLLQQLENNEAILAMYLADELGPEDRQEVEQMLASDAGLRQELERMRALESEVFGMLGRGDAELVHLQSADSAARRVGREIRRRHASQLASRTVVSSDEDESRIPREPRFPWWFYPVASAAIVVIAFLGWWGRSGSGPMDVPDGTFAIASAEEPEFAPVLEEVLANAEESAEPFVEMQSHLDALYASADYSPVMPFELDVQEQ